MFSKKILRKLALLVLGLFLLSLIRPFVQPARAATFTEASIRHDRVKASTADADILIVFKVASTDTEAKVKITYASGFTVNATPGNHTEDVSGLPSTYQGEALVAVPGIDTATAVNGQEVTFPCTTMTAGTLYGFIHTAGITNHATPETYIHTIETTTSGDAQIDIANVAVDIVTNDQITVSASVPATFDFTLSGNTIALGAQDTGVIDTGNVTVNVDTNASSGYIAWARSETSNGAALYSSSTTDSIDTKGSLDDTPETCVAGTECYNLDVAGTEGGSSLGTITEAAEYDGNGTTTAGTLSTTYQEICSSDGAALDDTLTLTILSAITSLNAAATDYSDLLEVVGAGNF